MITTENEMKKKVTQQLAACRITISKREHEIHQLKASNRLLQDSMGTEQQVPQTRQSQPANYQQHQPVSSSRQQDQPVNPALDLQIFLQIQQANQNEMRANMEKMSLQMENMKLELLHKQPPAPAQMPQFPQPDLQQRHFINSMLIPGVNYVPNVIQPPNVNYVPTVIQQPNVIPHQPHVVPNWNNQQHPLLVTHHGHILNQMPAAPPYHGIPRQQARTVPVTQQQRRRPSRWSDYDATRPVPQTETASNQQPNVQPTPGTGAAAESATPPPAAPETTLPEAKAADSQAPPTTKSSPKRVTYRDQIPCSPPLPQQEEEHQQTSPIKTDLPPASPNPHSQSFLEMESRRKGSP